MCVAEFMRTWSLKRLLSLSWDLDVEATKARMLGALRLARPSDVPAAADASIAHASSSSHMQCVPLQHAFVHCPASSTPAQQTCGSPCPCHATSNATGHFTGSMLVSSAAHGMPQCTNVCFPGSAYERCAVLEAATAVEIRRPSHPQHVHVMPPLRPSTSAEVATLVSGLSGVDRCGCCCLATQSMMFHAARSGFLCSGQGCGSAVHLSRYGQHGGAACSHHGILPVALKKQYAHIT